MFSLKKTKTALLITSIAFSLSACSLKTIKEQSTKVDSFAEINGEVQVSYQTDSPVMVAALTLLETNVNVINQVEIDGNGRYELNLLPGEYLIGSYVDANNNHKRDPNEDVVIHHNNGEVFSEIFLDKNQTLTLPTLTINQGDNVQSDAKVKYNITKSKSNTGKVVSLDDPMFSRENSDLGLWKPFDFSKHVGGGLMFLQPYDKNKTPVLFVHGISGSPTEFKEAIAALDTDKFQPWIMYYPSGVRLELVSDYILSSLIKLESKYGFDNFHLISHSMGGLVTRTFLREHAAAKTKFNVSLYVTINSPLYGMESAASGVKTSPIVIASWRDLATGSDYIKAAHEWKIPKEIPYHLFFSYLPGKEGDGVVPLSSQLSLSLQEEAVRIYGSQGSHAGVLAEPEFVERLTKVILNPNK